MQRPRFRLRTLMIGVAVSAVLLGGVLEYRRLKRLSDSYHYSAWGFGENVRMRLQDVARLKLRLTQLKESSEVDRVQVKLLSVTLESLNANIAANANLVQIYEHAASHPWETPPLTAEANSTAEHAPITKRFLTGPPPPPPPRPPDPPPLPEPVLPPDQRRAVAMVRSRGGMIQYDDERRALAVVNLARGSIRDDDLAALSDIPSLVVLNVRHTSVTDAGLVHLRGLRGLRDLYTHGSRISEAGVEELKVALPGLTVRRHCEGCDWCRASACDGADRCIVHAVSDHGPSPSRPTAD